MPGPRLGGMTNIFQAVGEGRDVNIKTFENLKEAIDFVTQYFT